MPSRSYEPPKRLALTPELVPLLRGEPPVFIRDECFPGSVTSGEGVVAVGDAVTKVLLDSGVVPSVAVVDGRTKRGPFEWGSQLEAFPRRIECRNRAGGIDRELWVAVRNALSSPPCLVLVEGEEDMAAIPAILEAEEGTLVLYGIPDRGVGVIPVSRRSKERAWRIVEGMVVEDGP
ncbi:MAG: DUF359 domain-containing protein [Thermoplasmata archaeon]|nr:MAG: DUF359 domain-containing protein [Thermoplasmata archaeon]HDJ27413.1 DUF359 domain-containing protein [Aciduliprofundum sp.]